ncbi:MAG: tRNA (guanosine(37)-N1)-methyltransferase TrmD [Hyphomonadaceae bacterium]|nr:tRNA (guanosine(37)-N1)-methyltransferase TrmD [Hyphomonadaceae bacterium]GIK50610.1 MAG: tRNA (guanine-N(1)-)-methyltransferase [Alphaproteobacteria bacterium]
MSFAASVITLFPEAFPGTLGVSLIGKALREGAWSLDVVPLRDFGQGPHKQVDDTPAGGGAGMVIRADVAAAAIDHVLDRRRLAGEDAGAPRAPLIYLSPRGRQLNQAMAREWAAGPGVILFCGRFEGLDERVIEARAMQEVAVGEAVLAGGEAAALVLLEACVRLLPGVLGNAASAIEESFSDGLLEHPQYTRPREWEGRAIPDVLLSGDHARIDAWRRAERARITAQRRPDLRGKGD